MSFKKSFKILLFISLIFQVILDDEEIIEYTEEDIDDMQSSLFKGKAEKIYNLGSKYIEEGHKIIAFADLNADKYTDIITYKKDGNTYNFYIFNFVKKSDDEEKKPKFVKKSLFSLNVNEDETIRNLHVGSFFNEKNDACYLISFNDKDNKLSHYIICSDDVKNVMKLNITSNILIMNKDKNKQVRILFYDGQKRKICKLNVNKGSDGYCDYEDFEQSLNAKCYGNTGTKFATSPISLRGGMAYVDIDGNCSPDIILSHEESNKRFIEVYTSNRDNDKYCLSQVIELEEESKIGAFAITRINDKRSEDEAPMLDILIPYTEENKIKILKNKIKIEYDWSTDFCNKIYDVKNYEYESEKDKIFEFREDQTLDVPGYDNLTIDSTYPTVIRVGDFLASSNPGILVKQKNDKDSIISLFKIENDKYQHYASIKKSKIDKFGEDEFEMGLFFDISETGILSFIIPTKNGKNYFFFNYKRNAFFLKSKLMNHEKNYFDTNLGATYRYIVTDKKGDRHMDIAHQLSQTSDTNIPLPYSSMGLDDTNNYVEYFQTISGNYLNLEDSKYETDTEKDWKSNSPIIPNTQMMIFKYYNKEKIAWNVDLIVQPMEQIAIFLFVVILVLIIVLIVIIVLHYREVKEEQKETNKFKSWFA